MLHPIAVSGWGIAPHRADSGKGTELIGARCRFGSVLRCIALSWDGLGSLGRRRFTASEFRRTDLGKSTGGFSRIMT